MEKFRAFFMALSVAERDDFAASCGTSRQHLTNICYGKTCGALLAINVERESHGAVRCEDLRPDVDWGYLRGTAAIDAPPAAEPEREAA